MRQTKLLLYLARPCMIKFSQVQLLDQSRILSLELSCEGKKMRRQKIYSRTNSFRCPDEQLNIFSTE